jgi:hypothetical protein
MVAMAGSSSSTWGWRGGEETAQLQPLARVARGGPGTVKGLVTLAPPVAEISPASLAARPTQTVIRETRCAATIRFGAFAHWPDGIRVFARQPALEGAGLRSDSVCAAHFGRTNRHSPSHSR